MDDETWGYKVCADNHERDTSVIRKSIKKVMPTICGQIVGIII